LAALLLAFLHLHSIGILSATHRGSLVDYLGMAGLCSGKPSRLLARLMLIYFFSVRLHWLPTGGMGGPAHFRHAVASSSPRSMPRAWRASRARPVLDVLGAEFRAHGRARRAWPSGS